MCDVLNLPAPKRSNCVFWLIGQLKRHGGGFFVRRSYRKRVMFHVEWVPYPGCGADELLGYSPIDPKKSGWDALWFEGHVISDTEDLRRANEEKAKSP